MIFLIYAIGFLLTLAGVWIWDQHDRFKSGRSAIEANEWLLAGLVWPVVILMYGGLWLGDLTQRLLNKQILFKKRMNK